MITWKHVILAQFSSSSFLPTLHTDTYMAKSSFRKHMELTEMLVIHKSHVYGLHKSSRILRLYSPIQIFLWQIWYGFWKESATKNQGLNSFCHGCASGTAHGLDPLSSNRSNLWLFYAYNGHTVDFRIFNTFIILCKIFGLHVNGIFYILSWILD